MGAAVKALENRPLPRVNPTDCLLAELPPLNTCDGPPLGGSGRIRPKGVSPVTRVGLGPGGFVTARISGTLPGWRSTPRVSGAGAVPVRRYDPRVLEYFVPGFTSESLGPGAVTEYLALEPVGIHYIAELYDCPPALLDDERFIKGALRDSVDRGMATLLHGVSHHFHPQGVTALGLIAESHVAIHTWPEYGYAAVDVFTCGAVASAEKACAYLAEALESRRHTMRKLERGPEVTGPVPASPAGAVG